MTRPAPVAAADTRPFWQFANRGELRAQRCAECGTLRLPPGPVCPDCFSADAEWVPLSGRGELQSWVVFRRQYHDAFPVPFAVGLIELDEGPRLEAPLVDVSQPRWRMPVRLQWREQDGVQVPCFAPDREESQ
jgi:uncharacterized OB-fold protein